MACQQPSTRCLAPASPAACGKDPTTAGALPALAWSRSHYDLPMRKVSVCASAQATAVWWCSMATRRGPAAPLAPRAWPATLPRSLPMWLRRCTRRAGGRALCGQPWCTLSSCQPTPSRRWHQSRARSLQLRPSSSSSRARWMQRLGLSREAAPLAVNRRPSREGSRQPVRAKAPARVQRLLRRLQAPPLDPALELNPGLAASGQQAGRAAAALSRLPLTPAAPTLPQRPARPRPAGRRPASAAGRPARRAVQRSGRRLGGSAACPRRCQQRRQAGPLGGAAGRPARLPRTQQQPATQGCRSKWTTFCLRSDSHEQTVAD